MRWLWHAGGAAEVRGASRGTDGDVAPVVDGPTIIVMRHGTLEGRDPRSGRVRWTRRQRGFAPPPGAGGTGVAVGPSTVVVGRSEAPGALTTDAIALDRATGKERWAANIPSGPITLTRNIVMVEGGALRGLDLNTGALRWEAQVASVSVAVGVDADAAVVANSDGIDAFDAVTGSQRWTVARSDHFLVQPGSGVVMMYRTNEPTRLVVDIKTGSERARLPLRTLRSFPCPHGVLSVRDSMCTKVSVPTVGWSGRHRKRVASKVRMTPSSATIWSRSPIIASADPPHI